VGGVISAAVALADPAVIVLGGSWGADPVTVELVRAACNRLARPVALRPALLARNAPLAGVRAQAVRELRSAITQYRRTMPRDELN